MKPRGFLYTEVQIAVPFDDAPWKKINEAILRQPGFMSKTWLSGLGTNSLGGFYAFETLESAQRFATDYFPSEARGFGVAHTTRLFDAAVVEEASKALNSPQFGADPGKAPGAFVYTEVQVHRAFEDGLWKPRTEALRATPGLLSKTWLSGVHTQSLGGFEAFATLEQAKSYALDVFPKIAAGMEAAFQTRIFDATVTAEASRAMRSPYYV